MSRDVFDPIRRPDELPDPHLSIVVSLDRVVRLLRRTFAMSGGTAETPPNVTDSTYPMSHRFTKRRCRPLDRFVRRGIVSMVSHASYVASEEASLCTVVTRICIVV